MAHGFPGSFFPSSFYVCYAATLADLLKKHAMSGQMAKYEKFI